jgi:hypothetical protein
MLFLSKNQKVIFKNKSLKVSAGLEVDKLDKERR